jgi:predicted DNA-binding transcriptional regulator AlpA
MPLRKLVYIDEIREKFGMSDSTLHRKMLNGTFPLCVKTSSKVRAWFEDELEEHQASLPIVRPKETGCVCIKTRTTNQD